MAVNNAKALERASKVDANKVNTEGAAVAKAAHDAGEYGKIYSGGSSPAGGYSDLQLAVMKANQLSNQVSQISNAANKVGLPANTSTVPGTNWVAVDANKSPKNWDNYTKVDKQTGLGNSILSSSNTKAYEALKNNGGVTGIVADMYLNKVNPVTAGAKTTGATTPAETTANTTGTTTSNFDAATHEKLRNIAAGTTAKINAYTGTGTPHNAVEDGTLPQTTGDTQTTTQQNGGGGSGGGGSGGGGGYSAYSSILSQLGGTGLSALGLGEGTVGLSGGYTPITSSQPANYEANAAAYLQLLKNAGYDLSKPLTDVALPNYVDLPNRVNLPENFNFQDAYNNIPEVQIGRVDRVDTHPEEEMLGQMADLQQQQAILSADNTVKNGIADLQRTMQNAQNQFESQRNQIAMDEQKALDNQVLYNEARGDRGGIGAEQYNSIQNTAATNRLTVQKEQTQLATDTARQIADLRSQGEFEKANQLLSISQKYLSELMDLYQWAKETNVSIDEFNLQVAQWEENFKLSLVGAELDAEAFNLNVANAMIDQENNLFNARFNQENSLFDARLNAAKLQNDEALARLNAQLNAANTTGTFGNGTATYAAQQDAINNQLKERQMLSDIGVALIKAGIQPSAEILAAMGMGGAAASNAAVGINNSTLSGILGQLGFSDAESALRAMGVGNAGIYGLSQAGITPEQYLAEGFGVTNDLGLGLQPLDTASLNGGAISVNGGTVSPEAEQILNQLGGTTNPENGWGLGTNVDYDAMLNSLGVIGTDAGRYSDGSRGSNDFNSLRYQNDYYPNQQSYNAAYITRNGNVIEPTSTAAPTYDDATIMAALGTTPEQLLRAAGIGDSGLAGMAALGISPAQLVGQAFGL